MIYEKIIAEINEHLGKSSKEFYSDYYIGITDNINERLFGFHQVPQRGHWYIYMPADTDEIARKVEKFFLDLGMQGGTGGGSSKSIMVYCYEISPNTKQK